MHQPTLAAQIGEIDRNPASLRDVYPRIAAISVDYGLMELADNILVIPADIDWDDVGSWESVWTVWQKDENHNAILGTHIGIDTTNCVIFGGKKPIATVGLHHLIIVETDEALLICSRERAQEVRALASRVLTHDKGN
jgi:mannose-1-phosphate guanylyltransferase